MTSILRSIFGENIGEFFLQLLYFVPIFLITIVVHEVSHGYTAYKLGDHTAKSAGRLTLNPLKHIDVIGFIMLILFRFGWAKPVPINPRNFRNPLKGMALTALAGPGSNLAMAMIGLIVQGLITFIGINAGLIELNSGALYYMNDSMSANICISVRNFVYHYRD
ncbi:hypothetical protein FACS1894105_08960 [Clostridia bacterium]|nr:hypothetical protein FACS1894105_08960 [Clostridia bacterium]